jgi:exopolysaccharide production protein ExoZ
MASTETVRVERTHTLHNLQALRALAALLVLYHHYLGYPQIGIDDWYGAVGVDIFFVISGFVITYAKRGSALDFIVRRVIRIVPLYWAVTLFWVALAVVLHISGSGLTPKDVTPTLIFKSLFFIPDRPIITRGWTLNFEMYFYEVFALSILLNGRRAALICAILIGVVHAAVNVVQPGRPLDFYGSGHVFEFLAGSAAFYLWRAVGRIAGAAALVRQWRVPLAAMALLLLIACCWSSNYFRETTLTAVTVSSGLFVLLVVSLEQYGGVFVRSRLVTLLGDASYSIYLVHRFVYAPLARTAFPLLEGQPLWLKLLAFLPSLALVAVVSIAVHLMFERPVTRALSSAWHKVSGATRRDATVARPEWTGG